ncbi:uncharacterized protein PG998_013005 [Apiospora kogelbergensis]|uniref:uncharacterized protein n=1 Tax=Apiospora kogelbergensis TaxID=1337665 RepID=UPI00312E2926
MSVRLDGEWLAVAGALKHPVRVDLRPFAAQPCPEDLAVVMSGVRDGTEEQQGVGDTSPTLHRKEDLQQQISSSVAPSPQLSIAPPNNVQCHESSFATHTTSGVSNRRTANSFPTPTKRHLERSPPTRITIVDQHEDPATFRLRNSPGERDELEETCETDQTEYPL